MDFVSVTGMNWKLLYLCSLMFICAQTQTLEAREELQNKINYAKQQLTNFYLHSRDKSNINLELLLQWKQSLNDLYPKTGLRSDKIDFMRTHNNTLMSVGLDLWSVTKVQLLKIAALPHDYHHRVRFVKSAQWQGRLFSLVCYDNNKCNLFTAYQGFDFHYCHEISDVPGIAVATEFFSQGEDFFLVVLFQAEHSTISQTILYQWQKTYMDRQLIPEITTTASTVIVFGYKESTILVLGCLGNDRIKFPSQVWRRESNGTLEKIQLLSTHKLVSLTHFVEGEEHFLLALEENKGTLYYWEGHEFVLLWSPVDKMLIHFLVSVSSRPISPTFLIFSRNNSLNIYVLTSKNLEKVSEYTFSVEVSITKTLIYYEEEKIYMIVHYRSSDKMFLNLYKLNVKLLQNVSEEPAAEQNPKRKAQEALEVISNGVTALDGQLDHLNTILGTLLFTNKDVTIGPAVILFSETVEIQSGAILNLTTNDSSIAMTMLDLYSKIYSIKEEINLHSSTLKSIQRDQNKHLFIYGDVHLQQAKINVLVSDIVNNVQFEPSALLKVKNNAVQRLSNVKSKTATANWLALKQIRHKNVKDLFMDDWKIEVPVYTSFLESKNLSLSNDSMINNIKVKDLLEKQVTTFTGEQALEIITQVASDEENQNKMTLQLQDHTVIEDLRVETIDSISINDLLASLYIKKGINTIYGNVHFKKGLRVHKLIGKITQPLERQEQLPNQNNLYQYQNFDSVPYWIAQNGTQQNPQAMSKYMYPPVIRRAREESRERKKPTKTISAKVKIIGNLRVERLVLQNSSLQINKRRVPTHELHDVYWTYSSAQVIHNPVNFTKGVSLSRGLENSVVNGMNLTNYATRNSYFHRLVLENVHVDGDVFMEEIHSSSLNKSIRFQDFYVLKVKHLHTDYINGRSVQNALQLKHLSLGHLKIFATNVSVDGDLEAGLVNGINVTKKLQSTVFIDEDSTLPNLVLEELSAQKVEVESLNGFPPRLLLGHTEPEENSIVHIKGDLHIAKLSDVLFVNNKTANLSLVVNRSTENTITGKKRFKGQTISTSNFTVTNINGMNTEVMFKSLLRTSTDQLVTGFYTIRRANFDSLSGVKQLNGIDVTRLLYTDQPQINIHGDVSFKSINVDGNIVASSIHDDCILPKVDKSLVFNGNSSWSTMSVEGDCKWELHKAGGRLQNLLDSAVTVDSNQTITGNISFSNLFSKYIQVDSLNDKNITFVFQDSVYRNKKDQVISGKKTFFGSIVCESVEVKGNARFTSVNDININDIDSKLVRHKVDDDISSRPVSGHKRFMSGFKSFILTCPEGINGIPASSLAQEGSQKTLPPMIITDSFEVIGNIQLETINGLHMDEFFKDCIYKNDSSNQFFSDGLHIKGNVILQGNVTTSNINNISISDLVYTKTGKRQTQIKGCQTFSSNVNIETNSIVNTINGKNLTKTYKESVKIYENATIDGSLVFLSDVQLDTIYAQEYLVGKRKLTNLEKIAAP